jgi:hypothetical protein
MSGSGMEAPFFHDLIEQARDFGRRRAALFDLVKELSSTADQRLSSRELGQG